MFFQLNNEKKPSDTNRRAFSCCNGFIVVVQKRGVQPRKHQRQHHVQHLVRCANHCSERHLTHRLLRHGNEGQIFCDPG